MGNRFGVDIGGTVARIVYFEPSKSHGTGHHYGHISREDEELLQQVISKYNDKRLTIYCTELHGTFYFLYFELRLIESFLNEFAPQINKLHLQECRGTGVSTEERVNATGGGSYKYEALLYEKFGVQLTHRTEKECTIRAIDYVLKNYDEEVFALGKEPSRPPSRAASPLRQRPASSSPAFPPAPLRCSPSATASASSSSKGSALPPPQPRGSPTSLTGSTKEKEKYEVSPQLKLRQGHARNFSSLSNHSDDFPLQRPMSALKISLSSTQLAPVEFVPLVSEPYPYLLVNFRSGISLYKVSSIDTYERVSGCALGGGTFWGLLRLLTKFESFEDAIQAVKRGDNKNVDMLVGDIYGGDYSGVGLRADIIASSFGKCVRMNGEDDVKYSDADIAAALLRMICYNAAQISYLVSLQHDLPRIFLAGPVTDHSGTMEMVSFSIDFWSKGKMKAHFLNHAGYLGAIGAFLIGRSGKVELSDDESDNDDEETCCIL